MSEAVRIHLYGAQNMLKSKGTMQKESLSLKIFERLQATFESWTDHKYGDSLPPKEVLKRLKFNLNNQVASAWSEFRYSKEVLSVLNDRTT